MKLTRDSARDRRILVPGTRESVNVSPAPGRPGPGAAHRDWQARDSDSWQPGRLGIKFGRAARALATVTVTVRDSKSRPSASDSPACHGLGLARFPPITYYDDGIRVRVRWAARHGPGLRPQAGEEAWMCFQWAPAAKPPRPQPQAAALPGPGAGCRRSSVTGASQSP